MLEGLERVTRVEIRGGAGSGKTWLAVEKARRVGRVGSAGGADVLLARARRVPAPPGRSARDGRGGQYFDLGELFVDVPLPEDVQSGLEERGVV